LKGCLKLGVARTGKARLDVSTEFLRRDDTHDFVVKFLEIVNIARKPRRDNHPGTKPSIDPRPSPITISGKQREIEAEDMIFQIFKDPEQALRKIGPVFGLHLIDRRSIGKENEDLSEYATG
jgi:hypothetical protein